MIALVFAAAQSWGALLFVRPYVTDFGGSWLFESLLTLVVGSVIMNHVSSNCLGIHNTRENTMCFYLDITQDKPVRGRRKQPPVVG